jgi:hypothetical protein
MTEAERLAELRELFLSAPGSGATRTLAVLGSLALVAIVLWLVRRRRLREEYTPIWIAVAVGIAAVSLHQGLLRALTHTIGAWSLSATLFFFGELFLVAICLNYAVRLSRITLDVKILSQEIALLRAELDGGRGADD